MDSKKQGHFFYLDTTDYYILVFVPRKELHSIEICESSFRRIPPDRVLPVGYIHNFNDMPVAKYQDKAGDW
jgi:hypothetical protein